MKKTILKTVHDTAKRLHKTGLIDKYTMHEMDALCIPPLHDLSPKEIKHIREREKVSQPVFAACLNISPSTIKKWETGEKHPHGASLMLLNLVEKKGLLALLS